MQFYQGHQTNYTYSAAGAKLKVIDKTAPAGVVLPVTSLNTILSNPSVSTITTTDYVGNMIYENGTLKRILTPVGYWQSGTYYYFLKDHLGSNRVVINSSGGIAETSSYYPSGMRFGESAVNGGSVQPYRHTGHEMQEMHGLNWIDNGARFRTINEGDGFLGVDPHAEKYYSISPYVYCAGNPIRFVDPDGKAVRMYVETNRFGHAFISVGEGKNTVVYTYGRYLGGDKGKSSSNGSDPTGRGVMMKLTGKDALSYIDHEKKDLKATAYVIKDANETKVKDYADKAFESGRDLTKSEANSYDKNQKNYGTSSDAKVVDQYSLLENNCTTKSIEAVKAGGSSLDFAKPIVAPLTNGRSVEAPIIAPVDLKIYLDNRTK